MKKMVVEDKPKEVEKRPKEIVKEENAPKEKLVKEMPKKVQAPILMSSSDEEELPIEPSPKRKAEKPTKKKQAKKKYSRAVIEDSSDDASSDTAPPNTETTQDLENMHLDDDESDEQTQSDDVE